jgi:hypothetical protein
VLIIIIIIIIIITIGKTALLEPQLSLEYYAGLHPVFTSLDFATIFFFNRSRSSAFRPTPNLADQVPVFMSTQ